MTKENSSEVLKCTSISNHKGLTLRGKRSRNARSQCLNKDDGKKDLSNFSDSKDLYNSVIKELRKIKKTDGLIVGTNAVLRLLDKEKLGAIFMYKKKGCSSLKTPMYKISKQAGAPFIWLEDDDKHILGPQFPVSLTYGIKKESLANFDKLRSLLETLAERTIKINKTNAISTDISSNEIKHPSEERTNQAVSSDIDSSNEIKLPSSEERTTQNLNATTFYHTHDAHISKKSNIKEIGFLSLNKFSTDERETDFLDYDSMACPGILLIK